MLDRHRDAQEVHHRSEIPECGVEGSRALQLRQLLLVICLFPVAVFADDAAPRARDLGVPFDGTPGPLNAITDVPGVTVGHSTVIEDYENGSAARAGVTAILPRGEDSIMLPVFGGTAVLNGAGEMTGTIWSAQVNCLQETR